MSQEVGTREEYIIFLVFTEKKKKEIQCAFKSDGRRTCLFCLLVG